MTIEKLIVELEKLKAEHGPNCEVFKWMSHPDSTIENVGIATVYAIDNDLGTKTIIL